MSVKSNLTSRQKIKFRIRKKIVGSPERPRLVVYRSLNNIYAQLVDDINNKTICSASSAGKKFSEQLKEKTPKSNKSKTIGKMIAQKALEMNIKKVVFDRNGYLYHGRVKAVADGAREGGLEF
jgi:large subunit ribosomal protein L18